MFDLYTTFILLRPLLFYLKSYTNIGINITSSFSLYQAYGRILIFYFILRHVHIEHLDVQIIRNLMFVFEYITKSVSETHHTDADSTQ